VQRLEEELSKMKALLSLVLHKASLMNNNNNHLQDINNNNHHNHHHDGDDDYNHDDSNHKNSKISSLEDKIINLKAENNIILEQV
jgi:hypothetical protein